MISNQQYLNWQKRIKESPAFRRFWAFWGIYSVLLLFIISGYLLFIGEWKKVLLAFLAFVLARLILSPFIYLFYKKARPYQVLNFIPVHSWLFSEPTIKPNSFPSDHAASWASISLVLGYFFPPFGITLILFMIINGMARVVLGYHDEKDILAGWLAGLVSAWAAVFWLLPLLFTL